MANISQIKTDSNWGTEAPRINQNFNAVNTELASLKNTAGIKMPLFTTVNEAKQKIPNKYVGQLVLIGNSLPAQVHKWDGTDFKDQGYKGGNASVPLTDYLTYEVTGTI